MKKQDIIFKLTVGSMAGLFGWALMGAAIGIVTFVLVASVADAKPK